MEQTRPGDTDTPHLPLARYQLRLRALDSFPITEDPRGLWHGVFGRALRAACCVVDRPECPGCPLLHQCQYSYLFTAPRPPDTELMRRYDHVPVPHCFQLGADPPRQIEQGEPMALSLVLVGEANDRLALVLEALAAAGLDGLGAERGRLLLEQVVEYLPDGADPIAIGGRRHLMPPAPPEAPATPPRPALVRIRLLSPYKASGAGARPGGMDLGRFLMAIVRRISLLQYFYTGRQLDAPFKALKSASLQARAESHALRPAAASRWASRHGRRVDTSGIIGHFDLPTDPIAPLWPYLHLGQWLNVGKNASMGFGQYLLDNLVAP